MSWETRAVGSGWGAGIINRDRRPEMWAIVPDDVLGSLLGSGGVH
jgi:hypothetical protein